jgi:hypothetical protein
MKMIEEREDVIVSGAQTVETFTIKASAKAFAILSQNLYSNPLGSMIRELSTNAYDAHIMVDKKDEPFVLTLPNSMEPTFKIRDFGPGMSQSQIMNVYTTFFESTKTESNDMVGCLGLGSKSPFGVADSFTVTTYYNGTKTIYSSFLNDARIPSIAKFAEFPTDEENGLEIEVAIKEDNFRTFAREVNNQLKYFKVKPIILGNADFEWHAEEEYLYEGTGWKMVRNGNGPRVVQGQIQYPISTRDMGKVFDNASEAVRELLNRSVLFEVSIGDVNIAPSREALSYDERTSKNIVAAAEKILAELPGKLIGAIENCETEYEARIKYAELITDITRGYNRGAIAKAVKDSGEIKWKGKDVSSTGIEMDADDLTGATKFTKNYRGRFQKNNYNLYGGYNGAERHWEFQTTAIENTIWVYATEADRAVEARSKQFVDARGRDMILNVLYTKMSMQKLANKLGLKKAQLVEASTLPKVLRTKTGTAGVKRGLSVAVFESERYNKTDQWQTEEITSLNAIAGFYVNLDRYDVMNSSDRVVSDFKTMVSGAVELGILKDTDVIYGLRLANQKKAHKLVNLFDYIKEQAPKLNLNAKYDWGTSAVVQKLSNNMTEVKKMAKVVAIDSPAYTVLTALIASTEKTYSANARRVINDLGLQATVVNMSKECSTMDKLYPLIQHMGYYLNSADIATYIGQMDLLRKLTAAQVTV